MIGDRPDKQRHDEDGEKSQCGRLGQGRATGGKPEGEGIGGSVGGEALGGGADRQNGEEGLERLQLEAAEDGDGKVHVDQREQRRGPEGVGADVAAGAAAEHDCADQRQRRLQQHVRRPVQAEQPPGDAGQQADGGKFIVDQIMAKPAAFGGEFAHVDEHGAIGIERPAQILQPPDEGRTKAQRNNKTERNGGATDG